MNTALSALQEDFFDSKQLVFADVFFPQSVKAQDMGPNKRKALTLMLKCEELGFGFTPALLHIASHAKDAQLVAFWNWFSRMQSKTYRPSLYKPMYPNFPQQVIGASDEELLINALVHYTGDFLGVRILPQYTKNERNRFVQHASFFKMGVMSKDDLANHFTMLATSNSALSEGSKKTLEHLFDYLAQEEPTALRYTLQHQSISQKETLAFLGAKVLHSSLDFNELMAHQFKTPTDLLRLSAALNGGDVSLSLPTKIKSMGRPLRKAFAWKLEQMMQSPNKDQFMENLFSYKERWIRLAHAMHIGEYQSKVPAAFEALQKVRSNDKDQSFLGKVQQALESGRVLDAATTLAQRPGVFARALYHVLSVSGPKAPEVIDAFSKVCDRISTPVLLQLHAKFKYDNQITKKFIFPKKAGGRVFVLDTQQEAVPKTKKSTKRTTAQKSSIALKNALQRALEDTLKDVQKEDAQSTSDALATAQVLEKTACIKEPLPDAIASHVVDLIEHTLIARFKDAPPLGNVFIDPALALQNAPFGAARNASKALHIVPTGSRFVKDTDAPILRFFTWWNESGVDKNGNPVKVDRIDIDLSVGVFDANYQLIKTCAYYDMRHLDYLVHSGDITSAPQGAAEYIDVDLPKLLKDTPNAAYVGALISSFTQQPYMDMPECYAGWMERSEMAQSGEIFEPSTVKNKVDICAQATQLLTCLYDIANAQYIWADTPLSGSSYRNNLHSVRSTLSYTIEALCNTKKPNLYDMFTLHAKARGTLVDSKEKADTIFSLQEGTTPFDTERISSHFMADSFQEPKVTPKIQ